MRVPRRNRMTDCARCQMCDAGGTLLLVCPTLKAYRMRQMQLIYSSRPFGYDDTTLENILFNARHHNRRGSVTGALICRHDIFLQMLEGPRDVVTHTFARILRDSRHVDVVAHWSGDIETRMFPTWDMRHDPARSWLWTPDEVWNGAVNDASSETLRAIFARVAAEASASDASVG